MKHNQNSPQELIATTPTPSLGLVDVMNEASRLLEESRQREAADLYKAWLQHADSPLIFVAHFNLGNILGNLGEVQQSLQAYETSLALNPKFHRARLNLGSTLERIGQVDEAIAAWQQVVSDLSAEAEPEQALLVHALLNLGRVLEDRHGYAEAEAMLTRALELDPDQPKALHHWVHLRQKQCAWPVYKPLPGISVDTMLRSTSALAMLSATDSPELQLMTSSSFVQGRVALDVTHLAPPHGYAHDRLRVAYLSSNFGMHAVSILTAELYELHDRNRFEVYGFCWSPEDRTPLRARIIGAMDHFVRIDQMSDEAAAMAIRAAEIDILVDLQGLTSGCRPNILARRPAPVQITYLGFPGTTALPEVDYVLADRYVIPPEAESFFTEKPLYLPDCFQVNDRKRNAGAMPTREQHGLPGDAVVFCAFNHCYKFNPELFATWMRILKRTPNSILWLLADNDPARINLQSYAQAEGIEAQRLVFAERIPAGAYLARFQLADLFLDTLPFNGGTTASDALWMGLPLLTCSGKTFASRMAGSLLHAIGLPELITTSLREYEDLAVRLATERTYLAELRNRLQANRLSQPLFDTPRFVANLENAYERVAKPQNGAARA
jgi:predicted O-linked N-acetylglucosamine transferase (SPINDLY family)